MKKRKRVIKIKTQQLLPLLLIVINLLAAAVYFVHKDIKKVFTGLPLPCSISPSHFRSATHGE